MTDDQWSRVLDVTLNGTFRCTRAALNHMYANGRGVIVNNASVIGWRAQAGQAHYAAAKAGVMALTRCAAIEAAPHNVRVNAVSPSLAMHANLAKVTTDELLEELSAREAFGRPGRAVGGRQRDRVPRLRLLRLHDRRGRVRLQPASVERVLHGIRSVRRDVPPGAPACQRGETEQHVLRAELDVVQAADRSGFKYVWVTEHHFLDEYSHLSASEAWMAYALAVTDNIHIGSGIINITPPVCHPARVAEKVAMLDQLAPGASSGAPVADRRRPRCSASASTRWTSPARCTTRRCPRSSR